MTFLVENALFHDIGRIFQPLFDVVGWVLAFIYGVIPNYAIAIGLLTVIIMLLLTPLTVKSTKSMLAMQRLQPEIKKLQTKYKGAENRQKLNEEMMALYKEQGINPAGGCLPMFLQMPFLIILYDTIKGLTTTVAVLKNGKAVLVNGVAKTTVAPRYIPKPSGHSTALVDKLYLSLINSHGKMMAFGVNLANKPFSHGLSTGERIPLFALVALAVALQYFQMKRMNSRNSQGAVNKQMQTIQKVTPILFAYIYFLIPAAVVIYMIISTAIRIATQEIMFGTGMVQVVGAEREISGAKRRVGGVASAPALVEETDPVRPSKANGSGSTVKPQAGGNGKGNSQAGGNGKGNSSSKANGSGNTNGTTPDQPAAHPRSRGKRPRKAR
jgi:YidC/Oxa1 family membrane protein insertase